jgi:hypothetical protein
MTNIRYSEFLQAGISAVEKIPDLLNFLRWKAYADHGWQVAELVGISRSYYSEIKSGKRVPDRATVHCVLALAYCFADSRAEVDRILEKMPSLPEDASSAQQSKEIGAQKPLRAQPVFAASKVRPERKTGQVQKDRRSGPKKNDPAL